MSGLRAKQRASAVAAQRGSAVVCQQDLDAAVTNEATMPVVADKLRARFSKVEVQLGEVRRERGLASDIVFADHQQSSLGRVAARRALLICHTLTIKGRVYHQRLRPDA